MTFHLSLFTSFLLLGIGGCASLRNVEVETPIWVLERPIDSNYYIGIAGASKIEFPYQAREIASENALNSLAREIRVKVSSSSLLSTLQVNSWVDESFVSNIESTVAENLEGFNLIDSYENSQEVFVYYRLSKSRYATILAERKKVALGAAFGHYKDAQRKTSEGKIAGAIERYLMGLDAMSDYLGELNPHPNGDAEGTLFDLDRALLNGMSDAINGLVLSYKPEEIKLLLNDNYTEEVSISTYFNNKSVFGIPLKYTFSRGDVPVRGTTRSSGNGNVKIPLNGFTPGTVRSELVVEVDVSTFSKVLNSLSPLNPLLEGITSTPLRIPILLERPKIYVVGTEKMFQKLIPQGKLIPALRAALIKEGVEVVDHASSSALILTVHSDTQAGGQGSGFFTAYLNATIELTDVGGKLIMQKNLERIKGVQLDKIKAGQEAYRKATQELKGRFTSRFVNALYE